jgi:uncharacterized protein (TIGR02284 family)
MEDNKQIIGVLNDLIEINADRVEGYNKAVSGLDVSDAMLKSLFYQVADESQEIKERLTNKVIALGGEPSTDTTIRGKVYRAWMDLRATFTGDDVVSTLEACEFGEDAAQRAYRSALEESKDFPDDIREMIANQQHTLKLSHDLIKNQRDQYRETVR